MTTLATDPEHLVALIVKAYNTGDLDAVDHLFEKDAVLVIQPGVPATGDERRRANADFIALGFTFAITVRHVFTCGEVALLLADHTLEGVGPDGEPVRMTGTATDVIRRGEDGFWRYVIDNPWGVDRPFSVS